ncbi:MAG: peptide-methionine (S)-S-oxide reductase MsrA [Thermoplasmata archaeon]|nr:peptide-methionine (S)-S-oxide reductase MsrA [Thermoplasmata archaeon]MCI4356900.1 peptide-methionine (S)-S-oxide reductase MsrA [Thermoplasmata archaeon]
MTKSSETPLRTETATLGGGCFWCTEAVFREVNGVVDVLPGYAGGATKNPSYEEVCGGGTGHAEVVQVTFAPDVLSYRDVLEVFFSTHDPTTQDRQGGDVGTQYRSAVMYNSPEQRAVAEGIVTELNANLSWGKKVVTQVVPLATFYPAEEYHRRYFERNPERGYCQMVIAPKMLKFRKKYSERLRPAPG